MRLECATLWIGVVDFDPHTYALHTEVIQRAATILSVPGLHHWFALKRLEHREVTLAPLPMSYVSRFLDPLQEIVGSSEYGANDNDGAGMDVA